MFFRFHIFLFELLGCGGSTHKSRYPCPFCACPNGQLSAPAPYRCNHCLDLDADMEALSAKDDVDRSEHERMLSAHQNHLSRECRHHDFLDSTARSAWTEKLSLPIFENIVKVIFPNESASALSVDEWRELGTILGINEVALASAYDRGNNRRRQTLDSKQWTQAIKDWKQQWEISYKNLNDQDLQEDRIDKVNFIYFSSFSMKVVLISINFKEFENPKIGPRDQPG